MQYGAEQSHDPPCRTPHTACSNAVVAQSDRAPLWYSGDPGALPGSGSNRMQHSAWYRPLVAQRESIRLKTGRPQARNLPGGPAEWWVWRRQHGASGSPFSISPFHRRGVAQVAAHVLWEHGVAGSRPVSPTSSRSWRQQQRAGVPCRRCRCNSDRPDQCVTCVRIKARAFVRDTTHNG